MNLPNELKIQIHEHISLVQQHLGDLPADEQREILQSIETHAHDALEARSDGEPTMATLAAILAEMDPPESYGLATPLAGSSGGPSMSSRGRVVFVCAIGILCLLFIAIWLADPFSSQWMGGEKSAVPTQEPTEEVTGP